MPGISPQTPTVQNAVKAKIMREEGFRSQPYSDIVGKRTVGAGFNIDDPAIARFIPADVVAGKRGISQAESADILENTLIPIAQQDARQFLGNKEFTQVSPAVQHVLTDMAFNLGGPRLGTFKKFRAALLAGDNQTAAAELLNSRYARQVPNRARRNAQIILSGQLPQ